MPRCSDPQCGRWRPEQPKLGLGRGVRLNGSWYCSRDCLDAAARLTLGAGGAPAPAATGLPPLRLGVLLRHHRVVSAEQVQAALDEQRFSGLKLGAQLRALGMASGESVLKALAVQNGVSYLSSLDMSRVRGACPLPAATVRALGLVPFDFDPFQRRVLVAMTAPLARAAVRAMATLTGWSVEPFLVDDAVWAVALENYRPREADEGQAWAVTASSPRELADHVAALAVDGRPVTMRHAAHDSRTWVRLEAGRDTRDVIVTPPGGTPWPVQPTAH
ncbi:MAG: hypothetical protein AB7I25_08425 [Vicinamibacterales bacterium]